MHMYSMFYDVMKIPVVSGIFTRLVFVREHILGRFSYFRMLCSRSEPVIYFKIVLKFAFLSIM